VCTSCDVYVDVPSVLPSFQPSGNPTENASTSKGEASSHGDGCSMLETSDELGDTPPLFSLQRAAPLNDSSLLDAEMEDI